MKYRVITAAFVALTVTVFASTASALSYSENFETMDPADPDVLGNAGWLVGGLVSNSSLNGDYDYFAFPAPNAGEAFSGVDSGQGGPDQGANQLSVYGDYLNMDHADDTAQLTAVVYRSIGILEASDRGATYNFSFDLKQGNIAPPSSARAFLLVQKTSDGSFIDLARETIDTGSVGVDWMTLMLSLTIETSFVGETLIIGFENTTFGVGAGNDYNATGMYYDNLRVSAVPLPGAVWLMLSGVALLFGRRKT